MSTDPITPNIDQLVGTVSFSRKVQVRDYESAEATIYVQFGYDREAPAEAIISMARDAFAQAKTVVFDELGVEFTIEEGGVIREVLGRTFGAVTEASPASAGDAVPAVTSAASDVPAAPPFNGRTTDRDERRENQAWARQRHAVAPHEFYDNRQKKASGEYKATSPDFKHKDSGVGFWLD